MSPSHSKAGPVSLLARKASSTKPIAAANPALLRPVVRMLPLQQCRASSGPVTRVPDTRRGHRYLIVNRGAGRVHWPQHFLGGVRICDPASLTATTTLTLPGRAGGIFSHEEPIPSSARSYSGFWRFPERGDVMPTLPMVGDELAGYRLRGVLGRGGMSVVYEAENPRLGSTVALKVLAPDLATDDVFRARFLKESRTAASLNHPNVIPIYDMGTHEDLLFIAMRYVAGQDLRAVLKAKHVLAPEQVLLVCGQAGRALDVAHRHGLVHRDVKPGNILVEHGADEDEPDHVYLTDFGITKHAASRSGLTATGEF